MTLEQLFINLVPRYLNKGEGRQAKRDIGDIEQKTQRLNKTIVAAGAAWVAFATKGAQAAGLWDKTLTTLAGKAGTTRKEFNAMFGEASRAVAVATGANRMSIAAAMQQGFSLSGNARAVRQASKLAGVLESAGIARAGNVLEAAFSLEKAGMGSASSIIDKITKGAGIGAREVPAYFSALTAISSPSRNVGLNIDEQVAMISTLSSRVKALPEAETQVEAFLTGILKPADRVKQFYQQRTGQDFSIFQEMVKTDLSTALQHLFDNFESDEFAQITQERTAMNFLSNMQNGMAEFVDKMQQVTNAQGTVEAIAKDNAGTYGVAVRTLKEAFEGFMDSFGRPVIAVLTKVFNGLTFVFDVITRLNNAMGGLIGIMANLIGGVVALTGGMSLLRTFMATTLVSNLTDLFSPADGSGRGGKGGGLLGGSNNIEKATLLTTLIAFAGNIFSNIGGGIGGVLRATKATSKGLGAGIGNPIIANTVATSGWAAATGMGWRPTIDEQTGKYQYATRPQKGWQSGLAGTAAMRALQAIVVAVNALLSPLGLIVAATAATAMLFRWFTRKEAGARHAIDAAEQSRRLRRHLENKGALDDTAPLPGGIDAADIRMEQASARRDAEAQFFLDNFDARLVDTMKGFWGTLIWPLDQILGFVIPDIKLDMDHWLAKLWQSMSDAIMKFVNAPMYYMSLAWRYVYTWLENKEASLFAWLSDKMGFDRPEDLKNLEGLTAAPKPGQDPLTVLPMSKEDADRLGLTGLPSSFENAPGLELRQTHLPMPSLPVPRLMDDAKASATRTAVGEIVVNQNITVNGAGDPESVANRVMSTGSSFMRQALDEALENNESPVVR